MSILGGRGGRERRRQAARIAGLSALVKERLREGREKDADGAYRKVVAGMDAEELQDTYSVLHMAWFVLSKHEDKEDVRDLLQEFVDVITRSVEDIGRLDGDINEIVVSAEDAMARIRAMQLRMGGAENAHAAEREARGPATGLPAAFPAAEAPPPAAEAPPPAAEAPPPAAEAPPPAAEAPPPAAEAPPPAAEAPPPAAEAPPPAAEAPPPAAEAPPPAAEAPPPAAEAPPPAAEAPPPAAEAPPPAAEAPPPAAEAPPPAAEAPPPAAEAPPPAKSPARPSCPWFPTGRKQV